MYMCKAYRDGGLPFEVGYGVQSEAAPWCSTMCIPYRQIHAALLPSLILIPSHLHGQAGACPRRESGEGEWRGRVERESGER